MNPNFESPDLVLGGQYRIRDYVMISAQAEDTARKYKILIGKSKRIWLVTDDDNPSHIIVQGGPNSNGYGGSTLEFTLANGCDKISLKGPWHSNSDSLFKDTGHDIRDRYITWGCIGRERDFEPGNNPSTLIKDLVYFDKTPTMGSFSRVTNLAYALAHLSGEHYAYYNENYGGSSNGVVTGSKAYEHRILQHPKEMAIALEEAKKLLGVQS